MGSCCQGFAVCHPPSGMDGCAAWDWGHVVWGWRTDTGTSYSVCCSWCSNKLVFNKGSTDCTCLMFDDYVISFERTLFTFISLQTFTVYTMCVCAKALTQWPVAGTLESLTFAMGGILRRQCGGDKPNEKLWGIYNSTTRCDLHEPDRWETQFQSDGYPFGLRNGEARLNIIISFCI